MIQLFRPHVDEAAIEAVAAVLRSGWIGLGQKTADFEKDFALYVGARHAVAVNSATAALHLAMLISDLQPGDEVLTTSLTFVSTTSAILYIGAQPVFVDVDDRTMNMDLKLAETMVTENTRAIVAVHYGGNPVDMDALYEFAARHGLKVIEDAAHACGASFKGKKIGSFGTTCFSFHAVKNLPLGDGGMVTTNSEAVCQRLIRLRWMGIDRSTFERTGKTYQWEYDVKELGYKYHMNDIAAVMGICHLKKLDEWNVRRKEIVDRYQRLLGDLPKEKLRFVEQTLDAESANHLCTIRVSNRNKVVNELANRGIGVGVHYRPNHHYKPFEGFTRSSLEVTERAYGELMSLPLHLALTDADVDYVAKSLREIL